MTKQVSKILIGLMTALFAGSLMATEVQPVGKDLTQSPENIAPEFHNSPRHSELPALNYVNQPPMVPHSVANYQVTKNVNQCLNCHSPENSRLSGATRISPTHFMDRDGNIGSSSSPRRYFCLQCHVSQSNVDPIVPNDFKPMKGYGN
ncbi:MULTISPECIES: nitrate reductase cytochrome c-type subunit [Pasteurellaceae]|uniref:Periplasmic nitrate reductase, electron transfer subunit n=1 Tax=Rodentibacter genomosp. 1 TaxID=1908264 RepID=A0A1V3J8B3_9PAST|nr:nitrate reductase cytochrome c-type subunit [Rodentibacter genomosp. 1]MBF0750879.1 nitrate reductase cytochrome c-type subunit [Pasteurella sp. 19428wF3_WM03]OOF51201.1 diacylglycerol kinase [Rodentibacter genomosp. 1]